MQDNTTGVTTGHTGHGSTYTPGVRVAFADLDLAHPESAFAYGLALGMAIEREAADPANDAIHRAALRTALREIERADARADADNYLYEPAGYQCRQCGRSWGWRQQAADCCSLDTRPGSPRRG